LAGFIALLKRAGLRSLLIFQLAETMGGTNNPTVSKAKKQSRTACGKGKSRQGNIPKMEIGRGVGDNSISSGLCV